MKSFFSQTTNLIEPKEVYKKVDLLFCLLYVSICTLNVCVLFFSSELLITVHVFIYVKYIT
jgi:hypothetical protein